MKNVLVVDDTKNIRNLLTTCLELNDYAVTAAKNGIEAMELIEKDNFDLAFIDIKMPELSGTEVLRRIRKLGFTFPVVIMTAYSTVKNAVECTKLGAVAYLQKPFTADKVNDVIQMIKTSRDNDNDISVLITESKDLINNNKPMDALKLLKRGLSLSPSEGELYYLMGKAHERNNDKQEADKYYKTAEIFGYKCP